LEYTNNVKTLKSVSPKSQSKKITKSPLHLFCLYTVQVVKAAVNLGSASNYDFTEPFKFSTVYWAALHEGLPKRNSTVFFLKTAHSLQEAQ
jgi:hypothetical protein